MRHASTWQQRDAADYLNRLQINQISWWYRAYLWVYTWWLYIAYTPREPNDNHFHKAGSYGYFREHYLANNPVPLANDIHFAQRYLRWLEKLLIAHEAFFQGYLWWYRPLSWEETQAFVIRTKMQVDMTSLQNSLKVIRKNIVILLGDYIQSHPLMGPYAEGVAELIQQTADLYIQSAMERILTFKKMIPSLYDRYERKRDNYNPLIPFTPSRTSPRFNFMNTPFDIVAVEQELFLYESHCNHFYCLRGQTPNVSVMVHYPIKKNIELDKKIKALLLKYHPDKSVQNGLSNTNSEAITNGLYIFRNRNKAAFNVYYDTFNREVERRFTLSYTAIEAWNAVKGATPEQTIEGYLRFTQNERHIAEQKQCAEEQKQLVVAELVKEKIKAERSGNDEMLQRANQCANELVSKSQVTPEQIKQAELKERTYDLARLFTSKPVGEEGRRRLPSVSHSRSPSLSSWR